MSESKRAADAQVKRTRREQAAAEAAAARKDHESAALALERKTERLKALRLAKDKERKAASPPRRPAGKISPKGPAIHNFASKKTEGLFAFTDDKTGKRLPKSLQPWTFAGSVAAGANLPHRMNRQTVETSIAEHGFQLWRMKKA